MFKFTHAFLLLEMLVATAQGTDLNCADLKSDFKALEDHVQKFRARLGEQIEKSPTSQDAVQSSKCPTCDPTKVAFFAGLSKKLGPVNRDTDVVFDDVKANFGSAYSVRTGRFTAPVNGTYQFSFTLAAQQTKQAFFSVQRNGIREMALWSVSTPTWAMSSNVAILSLRAGHQVWLQLVRGKSHVHGQMFTTFSGFLIFEN